MSVFILYIGKIEKGNKKSERRPTQEEINRVVEIHQTPQDSVVIKNTISTLPGGFEIFKEDDMIANIVKREDVELDYRTKKDMAKEAKTIRDGAKYSRDTSITEGAEPFEPN